MDSWRDKIANTAQIGGIETSVMDNGSARGTRIAWINTGSGLRYKVMIDRALDIGDAFYNRHSLAWLSPLGGIPAQRWAYRGNDWLGTFGGGLLVTCGPTHTGGPEEGDAGPLGLHDRISNIPAEIESIVQPDPLSGRLDMQITGVTRYASIFGPNVLIRRTLSSRLGDSFIAIHDEVINRGNTRVPHMLLYHCNFGWPLVDKGTRIQWDGQWQARDEESQVIFREGNDFKNCPDVLPEHAGAGEAAAFIDAEADGKGDCVCGLTNQRLGVRMRLHFKKAQLPWLINWQHWGKGEYVTGLEPATCPPVGQREAAKSGALLYIEPGEKRKYDLKMEIEQIENHK